MFSETQQQLLRYHGRGGGRLAHLGGGEVSSYRCLRYHGRGGGRVARLGGEMSPTTGIRYTVDVFCTLSTSVLVPEESLTISPSLT